jgi:predicted enzyme related to lactoylglutathione lyase
MPKVIEIAFSCYAVTDMARARGFYEGVLGLVPSTVTDGEHGQWVEYEIGSGALALGSAPGFAPSSDGCIVGLEMDDFDAAIEHLRNHGVEFRVEPMQTPVCRMAMVFDPDKNPVCIHKRNAS